jgi:exonuclease III
VAGLVTTNEHSTSNIVLWNVRGLNPKSNQTKVPFLSELAQESNPLFICLTETHLADEILPAEICISNYTMHRTDRAIREGGGVGIYVQDRQTSAVLHSNSNSVCEILIVKIISLNIIVCLIYRPPDCKKHEFLPNISTIKEILDEHKDSKTILLGDLNFPSIDWSDPGNPNIPSSSSESDTMVQINALIELTDEFLLNQLISQPTRGDKTLDLTFTNLTSDLVDCEIIKNSKHV